MIKPPYRVPSMAEIAAIPPTFTVVSTFAGGGGSSTGHRMAGGKVLWASEFIPAARETYRANCSPSTIVDGRDIRTVQPEDILAATGLGIGELDLFDGSPPCASYSTAGAGAKLWGKPKNYSGVTQRTDDLWPQFVRLLRGLRPRTFVAENVTGMVKGVGKGVFLEVLRDLKASGYRVSAKVLDASWLGVPQARQRLIFVGVRDDLGIDPVHPKPLAYRYSIRDALPWIAGVGTKKRIISADEPAPTIQTHGNARTFSEITAIDAPPIEPECDITRFAIGREWDRMPGPGSQSDRYFQLVRPALDAPCPTVTATAGQTGAAGVTHPTERRKFSIAELKRLCGFPDDFILTGRYAEQWERCGRAVPPVMMSHVAAAIRDGVLKRFKQ